MIFVITDLDDINNDCQCVSAFNGFKNIIAGFTNTSVIPCTHFDVELEENENK